MTDNSNVMVHRLNADGREIILVGTAHVSGLVLTAMRDHVSCGFYMGNFTFLVGVPVAPVILVSPPMSTTGSRSDRSLSTANSSP